MNTNSPVPAPPPQTVPSSVGPSIAARVRVLLSRLPAALRGPGAKTAAFVLIALAASAPAWIVQYPPVQDLPYHMAVTRVIRSLGDPAFALSDFTLTLGRTQYLLYYLAGTALSYLLGVFHANVVLVAAYFAGTVLSLRALLSSLGKDERLCLLAIPLLPNTLYMHGLMPFLIGIPLLFWGLATAVRYYAQPTVKRGILLGALALALFYSHVMPFGLFGIGCLALFPWARPKQWAVRAAPLIPSLAVALWWLWTTGSGGAVRTVMQGTGPRPVRPMEAAIRDIPNWLLDVFRDASDEMALVGLFVLVLAIVAAGSSNGAQAKTTQRTLRYAAVPVACVLFYFIMPQGHDFIWPLSQRFVVLFALTAIPLLTLPQGLRGHVLSGAALALGLASTVTTCSRFIDFQLHEVGDFDQALATMAPGKKVAALIYDRGSRITHHNPFLHFGSYYQVHKGGVVMFTFAGYPHWPFTFKPGHFPPPGTAARRRWEWTPEQTPIRELYPYYDYVLTRGSGFRPPSGTFHKHYAGERWTVWAK